MKRVFAILILVLTFTAPLHGEDACSDLFFSSRLDYKKNHQYRVLRHGDPRVQQLTFNGLFVDNGEIVLRFLDKDRKEVYLTGRDTFSAQEVNYSERPFELYKKIVTFPIEQISNFHVTSKLIFNYFRPLAKNEDAVSVVGHLSSSKDIAKSIADNMQRFDSLMARMGFLRPKKTTVVVGRVSPMPGVGPFSLSTPIFNIWTRKVEPTIVMGASEWSGDYIASKSVLYHERTHSILQATYRSNSWINANAMIQEALADFGAAHMNDFPVVGKDRSGGFIRDIEARKADGSHWQSLLQIDNESYHNNSMFASHILWRLRQAVGAAKIDVHFKSLVDDLNFYRDSYERILKQERKITSSPRQNFIYDIEYMLAVVLKNRDRFESSQFLAEIQALCDQFSFSFQRIEKVTRRLTRSEQDFSYQPNEEFWPGVFVHAYGITGMVAKLWLIKWWLF